MIYKDLVINDKYELRSLIRDDIPSLVSIFKKVFKKNWEKDFWTWFFYDHPYETYSLTLWDDDTLIGQYCGQKKEVIVNQKEYDCVLGSTAVVHDEYRGQGLFIYLAKSMYNNLSDLGTLFFYGFPNVAYSCGLYFKKFFWELCEKKNILIKDLKDQKILNENVPKTTSLSISKIDMFPKEIEDMNYNIKKGIFIKKTRELLNWRYVHHPLNNYENFLIHDKKDDICGYFVLKTYVNENKEKVGEIDDFFIKNESIEIFKTIYHFVLKYFLKLKHDYISTWLGNNSVFYDYLIKNDFRIVEMPTSWGFKILQNLEPNLNNYILNKNNWFLRMGDSDVF